VTPVAPNTTTSKSRSAATRATYRRTAIEERLPFDHALLLQSYWLISGD
jgi:hypothetical protein